MYRSLYNVVLLRYDIGERSRNVELMCYVDSLLTAV